MHKNISNPWMLSPAKAFLSASKSRLIEFPVGIGWVLDRLPLTYFRREMPVVKLLSLSFLKFDGPFARRKNPLKQLKHVGPVSTGPTSRIKRTWARTCARLVVRSRAFQPFTSSSQMESSPHGINPLPHRHPPRGTDTVPGRLFPRAAGETS